jgi:hypothetical protein
MEAARVNSARIEGALAWKPKEGPSSSRQWARRSGTKQLFRGNLLRSRRVSLEFYLTAGRFITGNSIPLALERGLILCPW